MSTFDDALRLAPGQTVLCIGDLMLDNFVYGLTKASQTLLELDHDSPDSSSLRNRPSPRCTWFVTAVTVTSSISATSA